MEKKYLLSVHRGGKVVKLFYAAAKAAAAELKERYKDCEVEIKTLAGFLDAHRQPDRLVRNGKPANRVACIETGEVYESMKECARMTGIPLGNIYKAIERGQAASGYHFKMLPPKRTNNNEDDE